MDSDIDLDTPAIVTPDSREAPLGGDGTRLEVRVRVEAPSPQPARAVSVGDDQVYAATELVRRGLATRVVLVNVALDEALPTDWEITGTPVHVERLGDGRTILTAGPAPRR